MNPIKLTGTKDGKEVYIWACSKCGYTAGDEKTAEKCCRCLTCGKELNRRIVGDCDDCWREKDAKREADMKTIWKVKTLKLLATSRIAKAEKLEEWDGWVFYDGATNGNDGYFESLDDLVDWLESEGIDPDNWPEYVFCCKVVPFPAVDLDDIVDRILKGLPEEVGREHLKGLDDLEAAIVEFNKRNIELISYAPDWTKVVRVKQ